MLVARLLETQAGVVTIDPEMQPVEGTLPLAGDLPDETEWQRFATAIRAAGHTPSLLAYTLDATDSPELPLDLPQSEWDRVLNYNLRGAYLAAKHLLPLMQGPGAIVLTTSVLGGWDTRAEAAALSASAGGILALSRSLALSAAPLNIRVNAVCYDLPLPHMWEASEELRSRALGRIPLGRPTMAEDIVDAIMFMFSDDAAFLTGSSLVVDGGQSLQSWSNAPEGSYS